jgi:hypothetical protein
LNEGHQQERPPIQPLAGRAHVGCALELARGAPPAAPLPALSSSRPWTRRARSSTRARAHAVGRRRHGHQVAAQGQGCWGAGPQGGRRTAACPPRPPRPGRERAGGPRHCPRAPVTPTAPRSRARPRTRPPQTPAPRRPGRSPSTPPPRFGPPARPPPAAAGSIHSVCAVCVVQQYPRPAPVAACQRWRLRRGGAGGGGCRARGGCGAGRARGGGRALRAAAGARGRAPARRQRGARGRGARMWPPAAARRQAAAALTLDRAAAARARGRDEGVRTGAEALRGEAGRAGRPPPPPLLGRPPPSWIHSATRPRANAPQPRHLRPRSLTWSTSRRDSALHRAPRAP